MLTGPLLFIGPLTIGRASDSQRGPVFLAGPDVRGAPTALACLSVGFHTYFMTYMRVSVASA